MVSITDLLGKGMYSVHEAALFCAASRHDLSSRWLYSSGQGESVIDPQFGNSEEKTISFLDFVQTLAIGRLRTDVRLSLQKIRQALIWPGRNSKQSFPLR